MLADTKPEPLARKAGKYMRKLLRTYMMTDWMCTICIGPPNMLFADRSVIKITCMIWNVKCNMLLRPAFFEFVWGHCVFILLWFFLFLFVFDANVYYKFVFLGVPQGGTYVQ